MLHIPWAAGTTYTNYIADFLGLLALVTSVEDMESLYSTHDVRNTKAARKLQHIVVWPNPRYFQHFIGNNLLLARVPSYC